jgi:SAM-dependent methyltransferase
VLYYWHSVGNNLLTWLCNVVSNLNLTDMETCYKVVRADILKQLRLECKRFGIEPELTIRLAQWGARIYEVPINYAGRTYLEGKKITWRDGLRALATIFWYGFIDKRFTHHDGYYILAAVGNAGRFNRWMFEQLAPFVGQRVLEAGCGTGNLTELMLQRQRLVCVDVDPLYIEMIERRFGYRDNFRCFRLDLGDAAGYAALKGEAIDSIICLNVLEHIEDDMAVLQRFHETLEPGGRAIILVPQHPWLYTRVDRTLGHCRRYTVAELRGKMEQAGFEVIHSQGFNKLGTFGWFVSGNIFRHQHLTPRQMKWFNRLLPVARAVEKVPGLPAQSLIMVGRKPAAAAVSSGSALPQEAAVS